MHCIECGNLLPAVRDNSTICSKCKTPLSTWWDESSQTYRTNRESIYPSPLPLRGTLSSGCLPMPLVGGTTMVDSPYELELDGKMRARRNRQSVEERNFNAALICLEHHFERPNSYLREAMVEVKKMVAKTLDLSLNKAEVRETLAKNVDIWMHLQKIFSKAIPHLDRRSLRQTHAADETSNGQSVTESTELILANYEVLREDLHYLNNLLVISRNMLAIKDTAQEICAAVQFDKEVHKLIVLCVNVTSKGYDGEGGDDAKRVKLSEIAELYKKLLVTCLQHTHNWTMGNDRFKMSFWFEMLFDDEMKNDAIHELPPDDLNVEKVYQEVRNWLRRHNKRDPLAATLLDRYESEVPSGYTPGPLPEPEDTAVHVNTEESTTPVWKPDLEDKYEQDRLYARVSHEIDIWWKKVRDANFEGWVVAMETVEGAQERAAACKDNAMHRYMPRGQDHDHYEHEEQYEPTQGNESVTNDEIDDRSIQEDNGEEEEEEEDDDDSYVEGPLRGLLTEIPNILDTKQIEALHMTVKACIVDSMGSGLTPAGENLQKTRCKMFLALDCGKNLLRELLVFIAVWEQTDQQFIFQITAQIIESFHHNALLPYAWNSLRILKDIVSPAQTVLLRLINYMFRARKDSPIYDDLKDYNRDAKLIHFLYNYFRCRVVPDCLALIHAQAQIRQNKRQSGDFPVDLWDMERAKDGLSQYLDFISVIAEIPEMRHLLVEWETVYELVSLLKALDAGVARKGLDEMPLPNQARRAPPPQNTTVPPGSSGPYYAEQPSAPHPHDTPHKFAWTGIKIQILIILTSLMAPNNARRNGPGNPIVQKQLLAHDGVISLLQCLNYDGNNEYIKERATMTIKFLMEGCKEAQDFVKEYVPLQKAKADAAAKARDEAQLSNRSPVARMPGTGVPTFLPRPPLTQAIRNGEASGSGIVGINGAQDVDAKIKELEKNMKLVQVANQAKERELEQEKEKTAKLVQAAEMKKEREEMAKAAAASGSGKKEKGGEKK